MSSLKYGRVLTATAIFACLAVFLCACGKDAESGTTTDPFVFETWSEAEVFTVPAEPDSEPVPQDAKADGAEAEKTILRRIETARAVYGMFSESRPELDKEDSVEVEEGLLAYRVADPHFDTMAKLEKYVRGYFSESITKQLLSAGIFLEYDGKLYALDVGMQSPKRGEMHVKVTEKTDTSAHYVLTVKGPDDTEKTFDFEYAKQKDGKWVFTRFQGY